MRSIRSNKEMITALLADYKSQNTAEFQDDGLPVALPLENKYENRFETNEIKRCLIFVIANLYTFGADFNIVRT